MFSFFASSSVLLLEWRQSDTLLISLHSSIYLLQRIVKHVLPSSVLSCFVLFPAKEIVCIYHGKRSGVLAAPIHIQGSEWEVEIFGHLNRRIGFGSKEDGWMGWEIWSAWLGLVCA